MKVADSYKGYKFDETKAYTKNGKLYVKAECKCDRCVNGIYVSQIENGVPVPHPMYSGVCLKCGGAGVVSKEIRLYTEKEYEQMENAKIKRNEEKEKERQAKIVAEYADKKKDWLKKNGYNENEVTFVYFPNDSFEVKEGLKENGFIFDYTLLWHSPVIPASYEDKVFRIEFKELGEYCPTGAGSYSVLAKDKIKEMIKAHRPAPTSKWLGEEKERLYNLSVKVSNITRYENRYGIGSIVKFVTNEGNICKWFTQTSLPFVIGDEVVINGTIKELVNDKYEDDAQVTILTRCKVVE